MNPNLSKLFFKEQALFNKTLTKSIEDTQNKFAFLNTKKEKNALELHRLLSECKALMEQYASTDNVQALDALFEEIQRVLKRMEEKEPPYKR